MTKQIWVFGMFLAALLAASAGPLHADMFLFDENGNGYFSNGGPFVYLKGTCRGGAVCASAMATSSLLLPSTEQRHQMSCVSQMRRVT